VLIETVDAVIREFELVTGDGYEENEDDKQDDAKDDEEDEEDDDGNDDDNESDEDDEEEEDSDDEDNEGEVEDGEVSAEEATRMLEKLRVTEAEDDEFEAAFRSVMQDSIESASRVGASGSSKAVDVNMARPAVLPKPKNISTSFSSAAGQEEEDDETLAPKGVAFKLLSRDSRGRVETRQLLVPEENQLSLRLARAEANLREEKQRLKMRVLQLDSLVAEDELTSGEGTGEPRRQLPQTQIGRGYGGGRGSASGRGYVVSRESTRGPVERTDDLNLSAFLAESSAAEVRRMRPNSQDAPTPPMVINSRAAAFMGRGGGGRM
jgi:hypothetical protein